MNKQETGFFIRFDSHRGFLTLQGGIATGIDFSLAEFTDNDLERFPSIPTIEYWGLEGTKITDQGLACLGRFPKLVDLFLSDTGVSGTTIPDEVAKKLTQLRLSRCANVTDESIPALTRCESLVKLFLDETKITDASLPCIGQMKSLIWLNLDGTSVTDAGIWNLRGLSNLKHLGIKNTRVTDEGFLALYETLPSLVRGIYL